MLTNTSSRKQMVTTIFRWVWVDQTIVRYLGQWFSVSILPIQAAKAISTISTILDPMLALLSNTLKNSTNYQYILTSANIWNHVWNLSVGIGCRFLVSQSVLLAFYRSISAHHINNISVIFLSKYWHCLDHKIHIELYRQ